LDTAATAIYPLSLHDALPILIATSAVIDGLGLFLLASAIFGPTIRPFLGLLIVYVLRQVSQGLCSLPQPDGKPGRRQIIPSGCGDRKSTRLNSSHVAISYAVF